MFKNVLAIDPGGTTGMAIRARNGEIYTFTCSEPEEVFDFITENKSNLDQVVIENFSAQLIGKWGLYTVRIVGGVYALCYIHKLAHKVYMPTDRYPFREDARKHLKDTKHVVHEEDALMHLLRWEYDNGIK